MSNGRNKYQSRESRAEVRALLLQEWDPIGVAGIEEAADEYDSYADEAYVMLMDQSASAEALFSYLQMIATEHMGLDDSEELRDKSRSVANMLFDRRPEFQTH